MSSTRFRVSPSPWWVPLSVVLALVAPLIAVSILRPADFLGVWPRNLLAAAIGAGVLIVVLWAFGWLRPALFERRRVGPLWPIAVILAAVIAYLIAQVLALDLSTATSAVLIAAFTQAVMAGAVEELAFRGFALVAARGRLREVWSWLLCAGVFSVLHLANIGMQGVPATVVQVLLAFAGGTTFYVLRRFSGSIFLPMLVHFVNNAIAANLVSEFPSRVSDLGVDLLTIVQIVVYSVSFVFLPWAIRSADERLDRPTTTAAAPAV